MHTLIFAVTHDHLHRPSVLAGVAFLVAGIAAFCWLAGKAVRLFVDWQQTRKADRQWRPRKVEYRSGHRGGRA